MSDKIKQVALFILRYDMMNSFGKAFILRLLSKLYEYYKDNIHNINVYIDF